MAKITPSHLITSISGKLCKKDTTYIGVNKRTGKMYSAGYHGCTQPNSEEQQAVKATFTKKAQFASAWWKQNRPSSTSAKGSDAYLAVMKAYKAQHKIAIRTASCAPLSPTTSRSSLLATTSRVA